MALLTARPPPWPGPDGWKTGEHIGDANKWVSAVCKESLHTASARPGAPCSRSAMGSREAKPVLRGSWCRNEQGEGSEAIEHAGDHSGARGGEAALTLV